MKNCPEYWEVLFAIWHAGLAAVPMNAKLHAKEFEYIVGDSETKLCFVTEDLLPSLSFFDRTVSVNSPEFKR
jgi:long-chain acyl-CoA synthetase